MFGHRRRQPAGAVTGGRFATAEHTEPNLHLADPNRFGSLSPVHPVVAHIRAQWCAVNACSRCLGDGFVTTGSDTLTCPTCNGTGKPVPPLTFHAVAPSA